MGGELFKQETCDINNYDKSSFLLYFGNNYICFTFNLWT